MQQSGRAAEREVAAAGQDLHERPGGAGVLGEFLAGGEAELLLHHDDLRHDFRRFMPGIRSHVEEYRSRL